MILQLNVLDLVTAPAIVDCLEAVASLRFGTDVSALVLQHCQSLGAAIRNALERACINYPESLRTEHIVRVIEAAALASHLLALGPVQATITFCTLRQKRFSIWDEFVTTSQAARVVIAEGALRQRYTTFPKIFMPNYNESKDLLSYVSQSASKLSMDQLEGVAGAVAGYKGFIEPTRSLRVLKSLCSTAVDRLAEAPEEEKKDTVAATAAVIATAEHTATGLHPGAAVELMVEVGGWLRRAFSRGRC